MEESLPQDTQKRFGRIETGLDVLSADVAQIKTDVAGLKTGLSELGHQMRVLHEDTIDRIKALAPDFGPIRREFKQADRDLRSELDSRLVILEAAIRKGGPPTET